MDIDLDQLEAARLETVNGDAPTVTFRGEVYSLPPELPFGFFLDLGAMQKDPERAFEVMSKMIDDLFGEQRDDFLAANPSFPTIQAVMENVPNLYGMSGESSASES
jgi:hypothetical protein